MKERIKNYDYYCKNFITKINYSMFFEGVFPHSGKSRSLLFCFLSFFKSCLYSLIKKDMHKYPDVGKIIFFSTTKNNNNALEPIWKLMDKNDYILWLNDEVIPQLQVNLISFLNIFSFIKMYVCLDKADRVIVRFLFSQFIRTIGTYNVINKFLKQNRDNIKLIVMANDHSMTNRCLVEACKNNRIDTMYVQHAAVSPLFPPLDFTYSFLDGLNSYNIYNSIQKVNGLVFISGNPRNDCIKMINTKTKNNYIGIATNTLDNEKKILDLCSFLKNNVIGTIILRPHPAADYSEEFKRKVQDMGIVLSDSKQESSFVFLSKISFLISNESSIHLDSALMGIPSCLYNFTDDNVLDVYGFLKNKLIIECKTKESVLDIIHKKQNASIDTIRYFIADYNSRYSGKISALIAGFIQCIINNGDMDNYISKDFIKKYNLYTYKYEN